MMDYRKKIILVSMSFWFLFTACNSETPVTSQVNTEATQVILATAPFIALEGTNWVLESFVDLKGNFANPIPDTQITLIFKGGQLVGSGGCNNYFASYLLHSDILEISPISITEIFCTSAAGLMVQEKQYIEILSTVVSFKIVDRRLQLMDGNNRTILTFTPQS